MLNVNPNVMVMNPNGDISICELCDVITEDYYLHKLNAHATNQMKVPSWDGFLYQLDEEIKGTQYYRCSQPVFLRDTKNNVMPIQVIRDEVEHNETIFIPIVLGESISADDYVKFWTADFALHEFGMSVHSRGLMTLRMDVTSKNLKRFYRPYKKLVGSTEHPKVPLAISATCVRDVDALLTNIKGHSVPIYHTAPVAIASVCTRYIEGFKEYWASTGKHHTVSDDQQLLLQFFTGSGFNRWVTCEIELEDCSGVAVFTLTENGEELYWDFSRRTIGNNIGNVLLYQGYLLAKALGCKYYNFGVGYYEWKRMWCDEEHYHKGIQFNSEIPPQLLDLIPEACDYGYNKDRNTL
ncbi:hypothetical protein GR11A_00051 [Vibrio phage vB_VcorM_GR11A]|nr:hypothetical protein GR11A_00051 [Vibrio phage vB_VcorM_GR11A]